LQLPQIPRTKKLFLILVVIIIILLAGSIIYTKNNQQQAKITKQFAAVYPHAQKIVDDAEALKSLNPGKSQDDFAQAEQVLKQSLPDFPANSKEHQQIADLLTKVEAELGTGTSITMIPAQKTQVDTTDILGFEKTTTANAFTQDGTTIYVVTSQGVTSITKADGKKKTLITNNKDWENPKGIATYQGNIYLLDPNHAIVKFVPSGSTFTNTNYFTGSAPDFSQATALAIDSSIYILFADGTIQKYTRGQKDVFSVSHLEKPFLKPTKIVTDADTSALYILDPNNSRIVKLGKDGAFQGQYASLQLKNAKDFEVREKEKKLLFLSGDTVYEIGL
jgi:hypothetical protein